MSARSETYFGRWELDWAQRGREFTCWQN
jgi:hypothetical protein